MDPRRDVQPSRDRVNLEHVRRRSRWNVLSRVPHVVLIVGWIAVGWIAFAALVAFTRTGREMAIGACYAVVGEESVVVVSNDSERTVESFVLYGYDYEVELGPIPPGGRETWSEVARGDDFVSFRARVGQERFEGGLIVYMEFDYPGFARAKFRSDGSLLVVGDNHGAHEERIVERAEDR